MQTDGEPVKGLTTMEHVPGQWIPRIITSDSSETRPSRKKCRVFGMSQLKVSRNGAQNSVCTSEIKSSRPRHHGTASPELMEVKFTSKFQYEFGLESGRRKPR